MFIPLLNTTEGSIIKYGLTTRLDFIYSDTLRARGITVLSYILYCIEHSN